MLHLSWSKGQINWSLILDNLCLKYNPYANNLVNNDIISTASSCLLKNKNNSYTYSSYKMKQYIDFRVYKSLNLELSSNIVVDFYN